MKEYIDIAISFLAHSVLFFLAVAVMCIGIGMMIDMAKRLYERVVSAERKNASQEIGLQLKNTSYWFTSDQQVVLEEAGKYIHENGFLHAESVRNAAENRIKQEKNLAESS